MIYWKWGRGRGLILALPYRCEHRNPYNQTSAMLAKITCRTYIL
jgi:hypothetical protein